jgi:hypothetical protein
MNFSLLKDSLSEIPAHPGKYQWYNKYLHDYVPIWWDGYNWKMKDGTILSKLSVRYWR